MKLKFALLFLALASLACLETTLPAESPQPAPTADTERAAFSSPTNAEPDSGAVYEIPTATERTCARVIAPEALHVRAEPNEQARVISWLHAGQVVTVDSTFGAWWGVTAGATTGYAHSAYLQETECE